MTFPRPNVTIESNVATRDSQIGPTGDGPFLQHVRGGAAIRLVISDILGRTTPPPSSAEEGEIRKVLRPEQYEQRKETLRCQTCSRVVYGPVKLANGTIFWKWTLGSECRCGNGV